MLKDEHFGVEVVNTSVEDIRQFKMMCERPPAAFGGSPPQGGGEYVISP